MGFGIINFAERRIHMAKTKNEWLMEGASYAGKHEMPVIEKFEGIPPEKLSRFSDVIPNRKASRNQWVCFYEGDERFEKVWEKANIYIPILEKFDGIITPDFSMYIDMPLELQRWNCWRGRLIGNYLQRRGCKVIPNVRFGDERTFDFCFDGLPKGSVISLGSLGCIKNRTSREFFEKGLLETVLRLRPKLVIIYGSLTQFVLKVLEENDVTYIVIDCKTKIEHKRRS